MIHVTLQIVVTVLCLGMLLNGLINVIHLRRDRRLDRKGSPLPETPPLISVCVPARNEAGNVAACLESLARQDYPNYEVLVLDDCSTDQTAEIAEAVAAAQPHLRVLRGHPLPPGWIGKPHACHQLGAAARGEWLLFTDADTVFQPGTLRMALGRALKRQADLLTGLPALRAVGFWERISVPMLTVIALGVINIPIMERFKHPGIAAASGAFLFFRRRAYEAIGGHRCVRNQIVEDIGLARAARRGGLRLVMTDTSRHVSCRMYRSLSEVWEGFSKNFAAVFPSWLGLLAIGYTLGCFLMPWIWFVCGPAMGWGPLWATMLPLIQLASTATHRALAERRSGQPDLMGLLMTPLAAVLLSLIGLRSLSRTLLRQPTPWRERNYELWR